MEAPLTRVEDTVDGGAGHEGGDLVRLGVERSIHTHPPVLALSLLRHFGGQDQVLVGVRTEHNGTHQNVMSVPTIRVLPEVAIGWVAPLADGVLSTETLERGSALERTVRHVVRELLALKLGKADALERGEVELTVEAMMAIQGTSLLGSRGGKDVTEDLTMFNAQVRWTAGNDLGDGCTTSYDPLLWVSEEAFSRMVLTRDVGTLDAGLDEIEVCVRGLCIDSTLRMLSRSA
ncbi:MAG: hypothetical protein ACRD2C_16505 [Acidimicrobiales bacterium]